MAEPEELSETFLLLADLAKARAVPPLAQLPGLWTLRLDENWDIAVNGHRVTIDYAPPDGMEAAVGPFEAVVWWNGWLAAKFTPHGGAFAAGSLANEATFQAAVRKAIADSTAVPVR